MVFVVGMEEHRRMLVRGGVRVAGVPGEARVMVEWRSSSYIATIPNLDLRYKKKRNNLVEF